ncbi:MAG: LPS export ABC transporter permease LptG [Betaproteobacteria bacterium]
MRTVRRLLYRDIAGSVFFVALAFLSLFFFIDFVDELSAGAKVPGSLRFSVVSAALRIPGHLYDLSAISVLIGTIYALSRMAQASEFTILRTAGLGPGRALAMLLLPGAMFGAGAFAIGEWVVPRAERQVVLLETRRDGVGLPLGHTGAWLKDDAGSAPAAHHAAINVGAAEVGGRLLRVRIFEFDRDNRLLRRIEAGQAQVDPSGLWTLSQVRLADWPPSDPGNSSSVPSGQGVSPGDLPALAVVTQQLESLPWRSTLTPDVVAAAVMPLLTMTTLELWRYSRHLSRQEQATQRYEIQFWKRALYPLACIVMAALALPFAYLHARAGGVSLKVFGGIMLGISFVLLNNLAGHIGMLRDWSPWWAAASPSLIYLALSLAAFQWLVRHR